MLLIRRPVRIFSPLKGSKRVKGCDLLREQKRTPSGIESALVFAVRGVLKGFYTAPEISVLSLAP